MLVLSSMISSLSSIYIRYRLPSVLVNSTCVKSFRPEHFQCFQVLDRSSQSLMLIQTSEKFEQSYLKLRSNNSSLPTHNSGCEIMHVGPEGKIKSACRILLAINLTPCQCPRCCLSPYPTQQTCKHY